ncbi:hypothetical protein AOLI_G00313370 [Acnodon oligacanthus]
MASFGGKRSVYTALWIGGLRCGVGGVLEPGRVKRCGLGVWLPADERVQSGCFIMHRLRGNRVASAQQLGAARRGQSSDNAERRRSEAAYRKNRLHRRALSREPTEEPRPSGVSAPSAAISSAPASSPPHFILTFSSSPLQYTRSSESDVRLNKAGIGGFRSTQTATSRPSACCSQFWRLNPADWWPVTPCIFLPPPPEEAAVAARRGMDASQRPALHPHHHPPRLQLPETGAPRTRGGKTMHAWFIKVESVMSLRVTCCGSA